MTPFWRVSWTVNGGPAADLYTPAAGQAQRIAQAISDIHDARMTLTDITEGLHQYYRDQGTRKYEPRRRSNPTLVHHGFAQGASYHLLTQAGAPLADLYVGEVAAKKVAKALADHMGIVLELSRNDYAGEHGMLYPGESSGSPVGGRHVVTEIGEGLRLPGKTRRNPSPSPLPGQTWRRRGGGAVRIASVGSGRVVVVDSSGNREWMDLADFKATHTLAGGRPNPKRKGRKPYGIGRGRSLGPSAFTIAVELGYPFPRGEGKATRAGVWLSRFTKRMDGTGGAVFVGFDHKTGKTVIEHENPKAATPGRSKTRRRNAGTSARGGRRSGPSRSNPRGGPRIVFNRLLGGWYVVTGPHQTPISGRFDSKLDAQAWLARPRGNPKGRKSNPVGDAFRVGQRVQLHAATDEWMQGDRYGVVVGFGRVRDYTDRFSPGGIVRAKPVRVKLDKSGRVRRFHPDNLFPIEDNPRGRSRLSVPEQHQLKIARQTLRMRPEFVRIMGGMTVEEARRIILELTGKRPNPPGDRTPIFGGKYLLEEGEAKTYPNLGHVRSFIATGKRGAVYGAMLYDDGRFHWLNLSRRAFGSVPFDLAQVSPARFFGEGPKTNPKGRDYHRAGPRAGSFWRRLGVPSYVARVAKTERAKEGLPPMVNLEIVEPGRGQLRNLPVVVGTTRVPVNEFFANHEPTQPAANPRVEYGGGVYVNVTMTKREVRAFKSRWPSSGLPDKAITFVFDTRNGDLVGHTMGLDSAEGTGALPALAQDAWEVAKARRNRRQKGRKVRGTVRRNPRDSEIARARRTFRHLNQIEPGGMKKVRGARGAPKVAVQLGELVSFVYESDKYAGSPDNPTGKRLLYEHKTKRPRPVLATDPEGKEVHIVGGRMHPTPDGLVN